jgi:hypothetical protein
MSTVMAGERRSAVGHSYTMERAGTVKTLGWVIILLGIAMTLIEGSIIVERPRSYAMCLEFADEASECDTLKLDWHQWLGLAVGLINIGMGLAQIHQGAETRLVLSPEGADYYSGAGFYRLTTPWENVAAIERKVFPAGEFLMLRDPAQVQASPIARLLMSRAEARRIPLTAFRKDWRNSGIDADLRRYAPHIATTGSDSISSDPAESQG